MSRQPRKLVYLESNCFHVLVQGINRGYIFETYQEKNSYLTFLCERSKKYDISILAFCVMKNHAHLLLYASDPQNISKCVHEINFMYAQSYNREKKRIGYVFPNRFKSEPIDSEKYLLSCIEYIHQNPVKAKMVRSKEEYPYSSAKEYSSEQGIVDFVMVKALLGGAHQEIDHTMAFIEDEYEGKLELNEAIEAAAKKLQITDVRQIKTKMLLSVFVKEVRKNTKVSLREMANILAINREYLRKAVNDEE